MTTFDERVAARKARERQLRRRVNMGIAVTVAVLVAIPFVYALIVGEGGRRREAGARPTLADSPSPATLTPEQAAEREAEFEHGLSAAIANIVATVPDPEVGKPRAEFILGNFQQMTGCSVEGVTVETTQTRGEARDVATDVSAIRAVEYAEPDWEDRFVVVTVGVRCP